MRHASRLGLAAVAATAWAALAWLQDWPQLPVTTALALSVGLGAALVATLPTARWLRVAWADLTACVAAAFWLAQAPAMWHGAGARVLLDLGLGALLAGGSVVFARAAHRLP